MVQVHTRDFLVAVYRVGLLTVDGLRWEAWCWATHVVHHEHLLLEGVHALDLQLASSTLPTY